MSEKRQFYHLLTTPIWKENYIEHNFILLFTRFRKYVFFFLSLAIFHTKRRHLYILLLKPTLLLLPKQILIENIFPLCVKCLKKNNKCELRLCQVVKLKTSVYYADTQPIRFRYQCKQTIIVWV